MRTIQTQEELIAALKERSRTQQHDGKIRVMLEGEPSAKSTLWDLSLSNLRIRELHFHHCEGRYIRSITFDNCSIDGMYFHYSGLKRSTSDCFGLTCSLSRSFIRNLHVDRPGFAKLSVDNCSVLSSVLPIKNSPDEYLKSMFLDCTFDLFGGSDIAPSLYDCFLADCYSRDEAFPMHAGRISPIHGSVRTPSIGQVLRIADDSDRAHVGIAWTYRVFFDHEYRGTEENFRSIITDVCQHNKDLRFHLQQAVRSVVEQQLVLYKLWAGAGK